MKTYGKPTHINRDHHDLFIRHTLTESSSEAPTAVRIGIEADSAFAGLGIFDAAGEQIADVTVELYEGKIVARIWNKEDMGDDPTARVELCSTDDLGPPQ